MPCLSTSHLVHRRYRATLKQANLLPADKRQSTIDQLRDGYRERAGLTDDAEVTAALKDGFARLGYLRTVTPRIDRRGRRAQSSHKTTFRIKSSEMVRGAQEKRRPIQNVVNDSPLHDVDVNRRLDHELERHYMGPAFWKDKTEKDKKWIPSICRPLEDVLHDAAEYHKGVEDVVKDEHKLSRVQQGKHGLSFERHRTASSPWDTANRGATGL
eukprot:TRINITY_DN18047_c0_g1_i4.p1 TRINITY_DN18047_c0_g1~~TRINITY_DN18047_c0_g1_i4.p1  ORF type:complete len:213 (+),score=21.37 TRINITY_DN18047_c0_g1_i4:183-821(+)